MLDAKELICSRGFAASERLRVLLYRSTAFGVSLLGRGPFKAVLMLVAVVIVRGSGSFAGPQLAHTQASFALGKACFATYQTLITRRGGGRMCCGGLMDFGWSGKPNRCGCVV